MPSRVLVVEDTDLMRESLQETLTRAGYSVRAFPAGKEAIEEFQSTPYDLVLCDLKLPVTSGLDLLPEFQRLAPDVPVVMITAFGTVETAVEAMRRGAFDYVLKPFEADTLELLVKRALRHRTLVQENETLRASLAADGTAEFVPGESRGMRAVWAAVDKAATSEATVLLTGESGTGKEVVARALHRRSTRAAHPFLCVNCAALSAGLLESELFGHEKGAFTGADRMRRGRFELADRGTLLLDEVSEIDPGLQAKLLRVLQERTFERVGSSYSRTVDVRVIATTNRDLGKAVSAGKFREDLFYRLNVLPIALPPLRSRLEDLPALAAHFLGRWSARAGRAAPPRLAPETLELFSRYAWPGNVRELGNILERAVVLVGGDTIRPADVAGWLNAPGGPAPSGGGAPTAPLVGISLEELERRSIAATLEHFHGNRQKTAESLGIAGRTLRDKIRRWRLAAEEMNAEAKGE
ncbi:MAG: sigma-54-dependent Fis family transcriptional regulator [Planctomycetes bacterium]|nr:sigma-54-dependent Fis family transcriptional regulator [Planctomycetota bacterium]